MKNKFIKTILTLAQIVLAIIIFLMFLNAFHLAKEDNNLFFSKTWKLVAVFVFFIALGKTFIKIKVSPKLFLIGLLLFAFSLRLLWVLNIEITPISDFKLMLETAMKLNENNENTVILNETYFNLWPYNIPFTIYESFILKITNSIFILKFLNILFGTGIVGFIYLLTKKLFNENSAKMAGIIVCFFPPFIIYSGILTNQTISMFFLLAGLYLLINKNKLVLSGICLGIGHIFRPIGLVFIVGVVVYFLFTFITKNEYSIKEIKNKIIDFSKIFIPYQFIISLTSLFLILGNFSNHSLYYNPASNYKLLVGLNHETKGGYSAEDSNLLFSSYKSNFKETAQEKIKERLSDTNELKLLFQEKFKTMWSTEDASFFWANWYDENTRDLSEYMWVFILFLVSSSIFINRKNNLSSSIGMIYSFLGMFIIIYLAIEIQARYRYEIYPFFIIIAGNGLSVILTKWKKLIIN